MKVPQIMKKPLIALAGVALVHGAPCQAQEPPLPAASAPIVIKSKTNPGNLPYKAFYRIYGRILTMLPPAPRLLEPVYQMSLAGQTLAQQDGYLKENWNVAIVGDTVEIDVPTLRGGYYVLPADAKAADEGATIMFNSTTPRNYARLAWKLRLRPAQTLHYQDLAQALAEVTAFQSKVPWYSIELAEEKRAKFDGLKACFTEAGGAILVDGKPAPTLASANCLVYRFDPQLASAAPDITLVGALDIVVLENSARYQTPLATAGAQ